MPTAKQHASALRERQSRIAPQVTTYDDQDLLVRHYLHVATQGVYLTGEVGPHIEALHAAGLRLLSNRAWGLRKTDDESVRTVIGLALQYNLGVETY